MGQIANAGKASVLQHEMMMMIHGRLHICLAFLLKERSLGCLQNPEESKERDKFCSERHVFFVYFGTGLVISGPV